MLKGPLFHFPSFPLGLPFIISLTYESLLYKKLICITFLLEFIQIRMPDFCVFYIYTNGFKA